MKKAVEVLLICPHCGYHADRAGEVHDDGSVPKEGDFSMCIDCGKWSVFDSSHPSGLRKPNMVEKIEIAFDPECYLTHLAWQQTARRRMH